MRGEEDAHACGAGFEGEGVEGEEEECGEEAGEHFGGLFDGLEVESTTYMVR